MSIKPSQGLSAEYASKRLLEEGPNDLAQSQRRTLRDISVEVLREPMFFLLIIAGAIYFLMGDIKDAVTLMAFVVIIIAITIFQ